MAESPLLVGWSQVSLHSFRRARAAGRRTLLEHATAHVDTWMDIAQKECARRRVRAAYSLLPRLLVRRMRQECAAADHVCVPSTFARATLRAAGVPDERILQVPLGVDAQRFTPGPPRRGPFRVLYVGRLELLKGLPYLLEAFSRLDLPGAELWLAGRVLPEVGPALDRAGRGVRVLGPLPHAALPDLYRQVDALAFPSLCDSFGLVLLEAMAAGLPVIATPRSAGPDLIDDGQDGYLVPAAAADALRDRLRALGRDREAGQAMGRRAREKVLSGYTWDHYRARYAAACARLLGITPAGAAP
jgi:glycosyltransferase involved in cell wall biosynthesis